MRVMTFSTLFPSLHPRKGEPTYFIEKIWRALDTMGQGNEFHKFIPGVIDFDFDRYHQVVDEKLHTIRAGHNWKVGDQFIPRIWSARPYQSKQLSFAPPVTITKVYNITKKPHREHRFVFHINGDHGVADWEIETANIKLIDLARNDGLEKEDFINWFPNNFDGQIICWKDPKYLGD